MTPFYHAVQLPLFVLTKVCKTCGIEKDLDEFPVDAMGKYGRKAHCKPCYHKIDCEAHRRSYAANPEHFRKSSPSRRAHQRQHKREVRAATPEKHREAARRNNAKRADIQRAYMRQLRKTNPLYYLEAGRRRDARKKQARIDGRVSYKRILERDGMWCYICEKPIEPHQKMHFDHVIPLDRDGVHSEENIKPTHKVCNLRKHTSLLEELTPFQRRGPSS